MKPFAFGWVCFVCAAGADLPRPNGQDREQVNRLPAIGLVRGLLCSLPAAPGFPVGVHPFAAWGPEPASATEHSLFPRTGSCWAVALTPALGLLEEAPPSLLRGVEAGGSLGIPMVPGP